MARKRAVSKPRSQTPPIIKMTSDVWTNYKATICKKRPETYALLGGSLDDPLTVTEFRYCPPERDSRGRYDAGGAHVACDAEYMNFVIDHEWRPNGKEMLGIWHSHPAGCTGLSTGDRRSNEGDIAFFSTCLENDDSQGKNWDHFLAPITTFDSKGRDTVTAWILSKGSRTPTPASVEIIKDNKPRKKIVHEEPTQTPPKDTPRLMNMTEIQTAYAIQRANILTNPYLDAAAKEVFLEDWHKSFIRDSDEARLNHRLIDPPTLKRIGYEDY